MNLHRRVGILVRISDDRLGDEKGVARQEKDCRAKAKGNGWTVAEVYKENDTSAYRRKVHVLPDGTRALRVVRPEYRRMVDDLASGRIDGLVAYDLDRVARDVRDFEDLIDVVERRKAPVAVCTGDLDLSNDNGVFTARLLVNLANKSSRDTSRRVRRKLEENAHEGKSHGGSRPFGWQDDRISLDPHEADAVRLAASMLLAGNSVKAIVRALNASGSTNTVARPWRDVTVRSMLLRPRNAGLRVHQGRVLGDGTWDPILDRDEWERVRVVLTDPSRRTTPGASGRTHLLSGLLRCGICGEPCRVGKGKAYKGVSQDVYRCGRASCVTRDREKVDDLVHGFVVDFLAREDKGAPPFTPYREDKHGASEIAEQVRELRSRLDVAAANFADGLIDGDQLRTITARLRPQMEALEARQSHQSPSATALQNLMAAQDVETAWKKLDVSVQRKVIVELKLDLRLLPTRRGPGFKPESVSVTRGARQS